MSDPAGQLSPLKQAYLALEAMQARLDAAERLRHEPIAVIGLGCRFPGGASSPEAYWQLLAAGRDAIGDVPVGRWDMTDVFDTDVDAPGKTYARQAGYLLEPIDAFDPQFFGISPREAISLDPQQRRPDISLAREKLCWTPNTPLEEGLEMTIAYFKQLLGI